MKKLGLSLVLTFFSLVAFAALGGHASAAPTFTCAQSPFDQTINRYRVTLEVDWRDNTHPLTNLRINRTSSSGLNSTNTVVNADVTGRTHYTGSDLTTGPDTVTYTAIIAVGSVDGTGYKITPSCSATMAAPPQP